jgi:twitching motility protein PilT
MNSRELLSAVKAAPWTTADDADAFVDSVQVLPRGDLLKVLDLLAQDGLGTEPERHRMRCHVFRRLAERQLEPGLLPHFVRQLKVPDADLRGTLGRLIPLVSSADDHGTISALLRSDDAHLRATAASILSTIGSKTAFDLLAELLGQPVVAGRREAMGVLMHLAPHRAAAAMEAVFGCGTTAEKLEAIQHLATPACSSAGRPAVIKSLAAAVNDPMDAVRVAALAALASVAQEDEYFRLTAPLLETATPPVGRAVLLGLVRFPGTRTLGVFERKLRSGPNAIRLAVLEALEAIGTPEVLQLMVDALGHRQLTVRMKAAEALARLSRAGRLDLARTIVWLLRNPEVDIRRMAVELAQSVSSAHRADLWPKLLGYLRDEDWWVRERVADALLEVAGLQLLPYVVALLDDRSHLIRRLAIDMLMRLGAPESLGALVRTAQADTDWWVRERALEAIGALGDLRAVPYLVDIMHRTADLQVACLAALTAMQALDAAPQVAALLASEDPDVRAAALRCLERVGDPAQKTAVRGLLGDPAVEVRSAAREVLAHWDAAGAETAVDEHELSALDQLLLGVVRREGDDLLLVPDQRPYIKRFNKTVTLAKNVVASAWLSSMLTRLLSPRHQEELQARGDVDLSYVLKSQGLRFRVNVFRQMGGLGAVFRIIRRTVPALESLGLPPVVAGLATLKNGLVLVGGPTGAGKSTTVAALVDHINRTSARHIITFEDPIEFAHARNLSLINQREVGTHTASLATALRATLRQDPDVLVVGELRDRPTISFAVSAAETGHLVFGTVHTVSAALTVDRLINAFPPGLQDEVRIILAGSLRAVVCQYLHQRRDVPGRCLSAEVMINTDAVANLIRKGKAYQIPTQIATSRAAGMQLMDTELMRLYREGKISAEDAYMKASGKKDFEALLQGGEA